MVALQPGGVGVRLYLLLQSVVHFSAEGKLSDVTPSSANQLASCHLLTIHANSLFIAFVTSEVETQVTF